MVKCILNYLPGDKKEIMTIYLTLIKIEYCLILSRLIILFH